MIDRTVFSVACGDSPRLVASPKLAEAQMVWKPKYPEPEGIIESAWQWRKEHPQGYD